MGSVLSGLCVMSVWWCCCANTATTFTGYGTYGNWEPSGLFGQYKDAFARNLLGWGYYEDILHNVYQTSGFARFTNVTVPNAATITSAKLAIGSVSGLYLWSANGPSTTTASCNIFGEDADTGTVVTTAAIADGLTRTSASAAYSHDESEYAADDSLATPSLVSIIQEIVNRAGWSSGNAMQFLFDEDGTSDFSTTPGSEYGTIANFNERVVTSPESPQLQITYT